MTKVPSNLFFYSILAAITAIFLWSTDGLNIGATIIPLGAFLTATLTALGKILWIGATFTVLMSLICFYAIGSMANGKDGFAYIRNYIGRHANPDIFVEREVRYSTFGKTIIGIGLLGLASGFWFSGPSLVLLIWAINSFRSSYNEHWREYHTTAL